MSNNNTFKLTCIKIFLHLIYFNIQIALTCLLNDFFSIFFANIDA